jgi:hypothetical protein
MMLAVLVCYADETYPEEEDWLSEPMRRILMTTIVMNHHMLQGRWIEAYGKFVAITVYVKTLNEQTPATAQKIVSVHCWPLGVWGMKWLGQDGRLSGL